MNVSSVLEAKYFALAVSTAQALRLNSNDIRECFDLISKLATVNNRSIFESFSSFDRERFLDTLITSSSGKLSEMRKEESIRNIRLIALTYVYDKHTLNEYKVYVAKALDSVKDKVLSCINIEKASFYSSALSTESIDYLKQMLFDDLCFALAHKLQAFNNIDKSSIVVKSLTSPIPSSISEKIAGMISTEVVNRIKNGIEVDLTKISKNLNVIAGDVFARIKNEIQEEINKLNESDMSVVRQREQLVNMREIEIEQKEKRLNELTKKNMEFGLELQKKSGEIEARMDEIVLRKSELDEMMKRMVDICKKVISMYDKAS